ncbi:MAG: hypothetical protein ISS45_07635 [Candidatus Omnitrophica bacterium]|nr:hypothetical protein [Candidatus Omnitrophota bacterium]
MPKAKLSQIAATWVDEGDTPKKKKTNQEKVPKEIKIKEQPKKKQTFNLRIDTIKRLWMHRVRTDKTLSEIMDDLVLTHLPVVNLEKKEER